MLIELDWANEYNGKLFRLSKRKMAKSRAETEETGVVFHPKWPFWTPRMCNGSQFSLHTHDDILILSTLYGDILF